MKNPCLGLSQLDWLDSRLCQTFPSSTQPFGRIHILLLGNFCQLPPIGERALYDTRQCIRRVIDTTAGQQLYQLFNKTIILTEIMRQQGQDETSLRFRQLLSDLRDGIMTQDNCDLLATRISPNLRYFERSQLQDAL